MKKYTNIDQGKPAAASRTKSDAYGCSSCQHSDLSRQDLSTETKDLKRRGLEQSSRFLLSSKICKLPISLKKKNSKNLAWSLTSSCQDREDVSSNKFYMKRKEDLKIKISKFLRDKEAVKDDQWQLAHLVLSACRLHCILFFLVPNTSLQ